VTQDQSSALFILGDHGQTVDGSANDVRGRGVRDKYGESIGKVTDLLLDDREDKVRFLLVEHGGFLGFGASKSLIPVDAITKITEADVIVDQSREHVAAAPHYDPDLIDDRRFYSTIYDHYGYGPYWGAGYTYPLNSDMVSVSPQPRTG
jgi:sporulation protein YlmC with PRC-barrel domain